MFRLLHSLRERFDRSWACFWTTRMQNWRMSLAKHRSDHPPIFEDIGIDVGSFLFEFMEILQLCSLKRTSKLFKKWIYLSLTRPRVCICHNLSQLQYFFQHFPRITSIVYPDVAPLPYDFFCGMFIEQTSWTTGVRVMCVCVGLVRLRGRSGNGIVIFAPPLLV